LIRIKDKKVNTNNEFSLLICIGFFVTHKLATTFLLLISNGFLVVDFVADLSGMKILLLLNLHLIYYVVDFFANFYKQWILVLSTFFTSA